MKTLNPENDSATHGYEIETDKGSFEVNAENRTQAAAITRKLGYEVYSVNFIG